MQQTADSRVLVVKCDEYDRETIRSAIEDGMKRLGWAPKGRVFVKPNVVFAGDPETYGKHAFTNPVLVGEALRALASVDDVDRVDLGENCAVGFPTRFCYRMAGYYDEVREARKASPRPVGIFCIDEERRVLVFVGGVVHHVLRIARTMAKADCKVYLPKLKCHCVSNMTGAVKLNVGICSDDERSIRHDFLLDEKIVDLLSVGYPEFVVMDAIEVGVGNEAFPHPRQLGLLIMGRNPVAVDLVGARLLGFALDDVPYLKKAVDRGYRPASIEDVELIGDIESLEALDEHATCLEPRDGEFTAWHDIDRELERLGAKIRFFWGPYRGGNGKKCTTGCVMGLKMFLASYERYLGTEAFVKAKPVTFVIGQWDDEIDGGGEEVFLVGSCARAKVTNARRVTHVDKCFTTASDLTFGIGGRLGLKSPLRDPHQVLPLASGMVAASTRKLFGLRYAQDMGHFFSAHLMRRI